MNPIEIQIEELAKHYPNEVVRARIKAETEFLPYLIAKNESAETMLLTEEDHLFRLKLISEHLMSILKHCI